MAVVCVEFPRRKHLMKLENNKDKGRAGLSLAIAYFGSNGYTVSLPINDTQWYDLIVEKDGKILTVQCKFTSSKTKEISLRSTGGTNGGVYDNLLNHPLDILFCADNEMHLYVIPMEKLRESKNIRSISLRTEKNVFANSNCFDTSVYLVQI